MHLVAFIFQRKICQFIQMISNVLEDVDAAVGHMQFVSWR